MRAQTPRKAPHDQRVLQRSIAHSYPVAVRGEGIHIWDATGKQYIDASGGAAVSCLGHGHPDVLAAMHAQLDKLAYAHTSFFTTQVAEELADDLIAHAPHGISHVYFVSGGSEAIEAALKMARQYFVETGEPQRRHFIAPPAELSRQHAGRARGRRQRVAPRAVRAAADRDAPRLAVLRISRASEPTRRRSRTASASRRSSRPRSASSAPRTSSPSSPRPSVGATAGARAAGARLLQARPRDLRPPRHPADPRRGDVRHGPHRHAARLRAGRHRARPDGDRQGARRRLRSRSAPCWCSDKIFDAFASGSGFFQHGHTYLGHPLACAAALAVQQVIRARQPARPTCARRARSSTRRLQRALRQPPARRRHPRAAACSRASSWSRTARSKAPFDPELQAARAHQARGDGARPDGLSDGRHDRRRARRPRAAGAAVHRRRRRASTPSSSGWATRSMPRSQRLRDRIAA